MKRMITKATLPALLLLTVNLFVACNRPNTVTQSNSDPPFDLIITNGRIVDGTGSPWYSGDVGIRDGKIVTINHLAGTQSKRVIDARGMVVAPGFIDMLGQSELTILVNPHVPSKIFQGITTEITGEGGSAAPVNEKTFKADHLFYEQLSLTPDWKTFRQYFARLEKQGLGINFASFVGATQVRRMVLGDDDRTPNQAELEQMKALVREAIKDGVVGVSTSLGYAPAVYAKTEELIALAAETAPFGGIYATHMRDEGHTIIPAIDEAIRIGREAKLPVEIWHLKTAGKSNWGRMPEVIAHIEKARQAGVDIAADTYAYTAWGNALSAMVPPWVHDGGDPKMLERLKDTAIRARLRREMADPFGDWGDGPGSDGILVCGVQNPNLTSLQGKTIADIASLWKKDALDTVFDLLIQDNGYTQVAVFGMAEPDVSLALMQPWVSINNDGQGVSPEGLLGKEKAHPRAYGTFPRILRKYVREEKKLRLEEAIRKFTAQPAQRMRLVDRGILKAGMWADVVIFDPETVRDRATFEDPNQLSEGMRFVLVNGVPVIDEGKATNALPGKVLRGAGYGK